MKLPEVLDNCLLADRGACIYSIALGCPYAHAMMNIVDAGTTAYKHCSKLRQEPSSCVLLLTEDNALDEMLRVSSNIVIVRAIAEGIHYLLEVHEQRVEEWKLTEIFEMGYEVQLFAVTMTRQ